MASDEKIKVKLKEVLEMYDIEDLEQESVPDKKSEKKKEAPSYEYTIEQGDKELEEEFDNAS